MSGHHKFSEFRRGDDDPERRARAERYKRQAIEAMALAELRRARALTQVQMGNALEMPQAAVSRLEHQSDLLVSTLRSYVEAMGGELRIEAVFPEARIPISTFSSIGTEPDDEEKIALLPAANTCT